MRVIIAGSRTATENQAVEALARCPWIGFVTAVVSGTAQGADEYGERWAESRHLEVLRFPADWKGYGRRAGPLRNEQMAKNAEGLVAVWDGQSRGTLSMIGLALKRGLRVFVFHTDTGECESHGAKGEILTAWEVAEERASLIEFGGGVHRSKAEYAAGLEIRCAATDVVAVPARPHRALRKGQDVATNTTGRLPAEAQPPGVEGDRFVRLRRIGPLAHAVQAGRDTVRSAHDGVDAVAQKPHARTGSAPRRK